MGAAPFTEKITTQQAAYWGMIWDVAADDAFAATWKSRGQRLAPEPTEAFKRIKAVTRGSFGNSLQDQLSVEGQMTCQRGHMRDFKLGFLAFLEKRPAVFDGR